MSAEPPPALGHHAPLRGIALILAAVALFPVMDAMAKHLVVEYDVIQVVWARYVFHLGFLFLLFLLRATTRPRWTRNIRLQIARSVLLMTATVLFFNALRFIPLADAVAINFTAPLLMVALSIPLLGEHAGPRRWVAVAIGFLAMLIIIRPGTGVFHWASFLVLGAATCYALYQIVTRRLSATDHPLTTLFFSGLMGAIVFTILVPYFWRWPSAIDWVLLALVGIVGALAHYALIRAVEGAAVSLLAPFSYTQIIMATAIGYLWFGDFPDRFTILGAAIIILCGLYIAHREAVAARVKAVGGA
jgi:drug/metabolite transporter (DMT)-like permease